jgi:hypothetical protein
VDRIRCEPVDPLGHAAPGAERQPYLGIGRAGYRSERVRRDDLDLVAGPLELGGDGKQGSNDTVHLGPPGVGDDQDPHQAAAWSAWAGRLRAAISSAQWRISIRPS